MGIRKKILITTGIILALNLALAILLLYFAGFLNRQAAETARFRKENKNQETILISLEALRRDSEKAKLYTTELQEILPTKEGLENFPKEIAKLARANGVDARFSFGDGVNESEGLAATSFRLTVSGIYGDITDFLKGMESGKYLISFNKVDVAREPETKKYSALISAKVYHR